MWIPHILMKRFSTMGPFNLSWNYGGCEIVDRAENLARDRARELFDCEHVNVQPHSGSQANMAVYLSALEPGDTLLGLDLAHGGHLTHGHPLNFSGQTYNFVNYQVDKKTERIDMDSVRTLAKKFKPKLILSGATAYPRTIDFDAFAEIAYEVNAYAMADISHIVGLVLAGLHPSPIPTHDIVMTTTTKTMRGPRSAIIISKVLDRYQERYHPHTKRNLAKRIDSAVFPGIQGGPLEHIIAAKAAAFKEALDDSFTEYQKQIALNAKELAHTLMEAGIRLVSGGTDTHLLLLDCSGLPMSAKENVDVLESVGIYTNFNMIPYDTKSPFDPSGIRIGTPALTTRGMKESEMKIIGTLIAGLLKKEYDLEDARDHIRDLTKQFPLYQNL
ncbi:MAG: serine hydroxymethyltransferase [Chloroflexi bacterium]|nr:serine hydroxymethyltransferase [Chloroflexota bacterium]